MFGPSSSLRESLQNFGEKKRTKEKRKEKESLNPMGKNETEASSGHLVYLVQHLRTKEL